MTKNKLRDATDEASLIDDWGPTLEAFNAGLSLGSIRKTLNVDTGNKGAQRVNNKPWDVTPERLAELIEACQEKETCNPKTQIEALELSLAKYHSSRGKHRGAHAFCGCCSRIQPQGVDDCSGCPLRGESECCDGLWMKYQIAFYSAGMNEAAEAVYQFILGKYWEEKEQVQNE